MHRNKTGHLKKGYITIYALIVCSFCIMVVIYCFYLGLKKTRNVNSYKAYVIKVDKQEEYKERAFTLMHKNITDAVQSLSLSGVKQHLTSSNPKIIIDNKKAAISYNSSNNRLVFEVSVDEDYYRRDLYEYKIVSGKLRYVYLNSTYIEGRIQ